MSNVRFGLAIGLIGFFMRGDRIPTATLKKDHSALIAMFAAKDA